MATAMHLLSTQTEAAQVPAICAHPNYSHYHQHVQNRMDPAIAPQIYSEQSGIPLIQPITSDNPYVQRMVDSFHSSAENRASLDGFNLHDRVPSYSPYQLEGMHTQQTGFFFTSVLNPARLAALTDIHLGQQANMLRQMSNGEQMSKGKSKGNGKGKEGNERPQVPRYSGTDTECSICQANFKRDEMVHRITCNHLFHEECWNTMLELTSSECECPNCRGPATAPHPYSSALAYRQTVQQTTVTPPDNFVMLHATQCVRETNAPATEGVCS